MSRCAIVEIKEDIDDMIMFEYLAINNMIDYVVLDPAPDLSVPEYRERYDLMKSYNIPIREIITPKTNIIFNGGAFTKIADYLEKGGNLDWLFSNGGYAGCNIVSPEDELKKFKGKQFVRTFNLNMDAFSGAYVLDHGDHVIRNIVLVSENVCHSILNTREHLFKGEAFDFIDKYNLREGKRLHDLLMATEAQLYLSKQDVRLKYQRVTLVTEDGIQKEFTKWGSHPDEESNILISTGFK